MNIRRGAITPERASLNYINRLRTDGDMEGKEANTDGRADGRALGVESISFLSLAG